MKFDIYPEIQKRARRARAMGLDGRKSEAYIFSDDPIGRRRDRVSERMERREVEEWSKHARKAVR